jgi:hypothetical protein
MRTLFYRLKCINDQLFPNDIRCKHRGVVFEGIQDLGATMTNVGKGHLLFLKAIFDFF